MTLRYRDELGVDLTADQIDENFRTLADQLESLLSTLPTPIQLTGATLAGRQLTFHLSNGTTWPPITLPVFAFRWRGDWLPSTAYLEQDTFKVDGVGVFWVLRSHTSTSGDFDPAAVDDDDTPLYFQLFGISALTGLGSLLDVDLSGLQDGQLIRWDNSTGKWEAAWPGVVSIATKTANYTVVTADKGLHFNNHGASGNINLSLPDAAPGLIYGALVDAAHEVKFTANGTDKIAVGATNSGSGGNVASSTAFSYIEIECHVAGQWITRSVVGSWAIT